MVDVHFIGIKKQLIERMVTAELHNRVNPLRLSQRTGANLIINSQDSWRARSSGAIEYKAFGNI